MSMGTNLRMWLVIIGGWIASGPHYGFLAPDFYAQLGLLLGSLVLARLSALAKRWQIITAPCILALPVIVWQSSALKITAFYAGVLGLTAVCWMWQQHIKLSLSTDEPSPRRLLSLQAILTVVAGVCSWQLETIRVVLPFLLLHFVSCLDILRGRYSPAYLASMALAAVFAWGFYLEKLLHEWIIL